jgi:hypothetical protein
MQQKYPFNSPLSYNKHRNKHSLFLGIDQEEYEEPCPQNQNAAISPKTSKRRLNFQIFLLK